MPKISQENTQLDVLSAIKNPYNNMDFFTAVEMGLIKDWSFNRKFGRRAAVGTTLVPVVQSGVYSTPTTATALEILSDDADDSYTGAGARVVRVIGLDSSWNLCSQDINMDGLNAVSIAIPLIRHFRTIVMSSGTYATQSAASQQGTITIRESGAGTTWATLGLAATGFGFGQSLIGCYTVPIGYEAYVFTSETSIENTKAASLYFFKRENANIVTAPYSGMNVVETHEFTNGYSGNASGFIGKFGGCTDMGYMAKTASGTADISLDFKIYLKKLTK